MIIEVLQGVINKDGKYKVMGKPRSVLDKEWDTFVLYQFELKQYTEDTSEFNGNLEKYYSLLIGYRSPWMEQNLARETYFK